jgi:malonate transporter
MQIAWLLAPDIALIVLGLVLRRTFFGEPAFWTSLERLIYFVLFPALLFITIARHPLHLGLAGPVLGSAIGAALGGIALGHSVRLVLNVDARQFASGVQCAFRFNSYVLLALSERLGGPDGLALAALIMGFSVPLLNVAAVYPLARNTGSGVAGELARNPLILATLLGLVANLSGFALPPIAGATVDRLGAASLALGLLAAGAGLRFEHLRATDPATRTSAARLTIWFTAVKLLAMPSLGLLLSMLAGLEGTARAIVVLYTSMPTAPAAFILASRMGGDGPFVAWLVSVSLIGSAFALPFWLSLSGP